MEEDDAKQTLFRRKTAQRNGEGCRMCRKKYWKCISTCLTWEAVLLVVHVLVFLIIFYKWVKDGRLDQVNKKLFRTYKSAGHFLQGVLFVLLIVPFRFNKRVIKWIFNFAMKNETPADEGRRDGCQEPYGDIEENKLGNYLSNEEEDDAGGSERNSAMNTALSSLDDDNGGSLPVGNLPVGNLPVGNLPVDDHFAETTELDAGRRDGHPQLSRIGSTTNSTRGGNGMGGHQNGSAGKNTSGERSAMNRRRKGSSCSSDSLSGEHTNGSIPLCESFVNSLVFPINTPKYRREEVQYFFLCAKLFSKKKISFLFFLKYGCSFILMVAYPLYNLVKRKMLHKYFYFTSYYMNAFDFASGLLAGFLFVLVYGVVKFLANLYMNRKNEKFHFYESYPFLGDVHCLCDENVRIVIHNNPHLKGMAVHYFNSYETYRCFLFIGILILFLVCVCSFAFSLSSMGAPAPVAGGRVEVGL
ncbi:conserved Plasmodium membrane protein, unknown function [Plasmodium vivax]|uniref:Uncharacterized protein n=1 Tax=Plasmodium vivax TaxID=5855 RepID=A0A1G4GUC3_PLAVI|nr:conserved Plasmodium membrane protein, unknown function [Plasmodium vivax]